MKNRWCVIASILFMGCQSTPDKVEHSEDCASLPTGNVKDDCRHFIVDIFKADAKRGMEIMQQEISNDNVRDYCTGSDSKSGSYDNEVLSADTIPNAIETLSDTGVTSTLTP